MILYGIKNCDPVKKARQWLDANAIAYRFHDFRVDGLSAAQLQQFAVQVDWHVLLNKNSTSWRKLTAEEQSDLTQDKAIALMLAQPTLIKRPLLQTSRKLLVGFNPDIYASELIIL